MVLREKNILNLTLTTLTLTLTPTARPSYPKPNPNPNPNLNPLLGGLEGEEHPGEPAHLGLRGHAVQRLPVPAG